MSVDATRWAWVQQCKSSHKIVLLSLADRANEHHVCWPSIKRLAKDTCANEKTVRAALAALELAGLIRRERRHGTSDLYRLIGVRSREDEYSTPTKLGTPTKSGTLPLPKTGGAPLPNLVPPPSQIRYPNLKENLSDESKTKPIRVLQECIDDFDEDIPIDRVKNHPLETA